MLDIRTDIRSLTEFKRNTLELVKQIKKSKRPLVLTVNGKAELVVLDAAAYQTLVDSAGLGSGSTGPSRGRAVQRDQHEQPVLAGWQADDEADIQGDGSFPGFRGQGGTGAADVEVD